MIKILYLIDFLYGFGGTEKHLFQLASRLDRNRFDCVVCPFQYKPRIIKTFREAGIPVEPTPIERIYGFSALKQLQRIRRLIREREIDIVQTFNLGSDIYGTLIAKLSGVPVMISSRRDLGIYRKKRHLMLTKFINRYVTHYLAVCDTVAKDLSSTERVDLDKITVIYNGFDPTGLSLVNQETVVRFRREMKIGPKSFVIGNVSHFRPEKGHEVFFDAVRKIKSSIPHLRVLTVGVGPLRSYFENAISKGELRGIVTFAGYVENVLDYVQLMDVCCLTAISNEGFSNAVLEQMAMGKPVIATDVGGNQEAILHGESGIIIPPNDVNALVEAIMSLYKNVELRKLMGANARRRVQKQFTLEKMISQMEEFYYGLYMNRMHGRKGKSLEMVSTSKN